MTEPSVTGEMQKETVKRLDRLVDERRRESDLAGLLELQAEASTLAVEMSGRDRRRAERVAQRASAAADNLRRNGVETEHERAARIIRETTEARMRGEEARKTLLRRLTALLHLFLYEGSPFAKDFAELRGLATNDDTGFLQIEIPGFVTSRVGLLVDGFDRSCTIFEQNVVSVKRASMERELKAAGVSLVSSGAEVRGLGRDVVPLIAYALAVGRLPSAVDASDKLAGEVDDLVLGVSDELSRIPPKGRPIFISLLRLAILLGEAAAYSQRHSLTSLSIPAKT